MGPRTEAVVVSDDPVLGSLVRERLLSERIRVTEASDESTLRAILQAEEPPLLVVDGILATPETHTLLSRLPTLCYGRRAPSVLLLTGSGAPSELLYHPQVTATLVVPFASGDLVQAVVELLPPRRQRSETRLRVPTPLPENGTG